MKDAPGNNGDSAAPSTDPVEAPANAAAAPALHVVEIRQLDESSERTGNPPRPKYYGIFVDDERVHEVVIQHRDMVRFLLPGRSRGVVTFLPSPDQEVPNPFREAGPFGRNGVFVEGERTIGCKLQPLPKGARWRWSFTIYLQDRDHLVDGNSTPVIIVKDPG